MPDLFTWLLVFLRATALMSVFPVFSATQVPRQIRVALGALTAFLIAPLVPVVPSAGRDLWAIVGFMALEVLFGLVLGFVARLFLYAVEIAGAIMAAEIGLTMPGGLNPFTNASTSEVGTILQYLAGMLFLTLNLHHGLLVAFQRSYQFLPVGAGHIREVLVVDLFSRTSHLFWFALQMAAPVLAVSFLITLIFSVLARAVPQMNVFTENIGVRLLAGMSIFGLTCHLLGQHIANYLARLPEDLLRVAKMLGT